jgi:hypothetical protein
MVATLTPQGVRQGPVAGKPSSYADMKTTQEPTLVATLTPRGVRQGLVAGKPGSYGGT